MTLPEADKADYKDHFSPEAPGGCLVLRFSLSPEHISSPHGEP